MTSKRRPKLVIVCMIYYPHERVGGSWADRGKSGCLTCCAAAPVQQHSVLLAAANCLDRPRAVCRFYALVFPMFSSRVDAAVLSPLGYNSNPGRLQRLIRKIYELGTCEVRVPGTRVIPCPLFEILDASPDSGDYIQRVEPSEAGGIKMARWFVDTVQREYGRDATDAAAAPAAAGTAATGGSLLGGSTAATGAGGAGGSGAAPA